MTELSLFLARALTVETLAGDRYREMAQDMDARGRDDLANLFGRLSEFSRRHASDVRRLAQEHDALTPLSPGHYDWPGAEPPEVCDASALTDAAGAADAIALALEHERQGWDYYRQVAASASCPDTRRLSACFAEEEAEHVRTLERWLSWARQTVRP